MEIPIGIKVLEANNLLAARNQEIFRENEVFVLNIMSSPGSGKTTLLEKTIEALQGELKIGVIEGDIYTDRDAERIKKYGIPVVQINTYGSCHLDARMVKDVLGLFNLKELDLLIIENVGNLVCPAEFRLGEQARVAVLSVPEGDDKPVKYPVVFRESEVALLNKIDLLPYFDFNLERVEKEIKEINPQIEIFQLSCKTLEGFSAWLEWLRKGIQRG